MITHCGEVADRNQRIVRRKDHVTRDTRQLPLLYLALLRFKVQYLVHEDSQLHPFQKAHDFLVKSKSFRPRDRMEPRGLNPCDGTADWKELEEVHSDAVTSILESARHLLEKGLQMPPPMATFFDNFGVSEELLTPTMIELINNIWREQEQVGDEDSTVRLDRSAFF